MSSRPLDLQVDSNQIQLKTGIYQFKYNPSAGGKISPSIAVDLYSLVHIADREYYENIESLMRSYDIVLYELITDKENIVIELSQEVITEYRDDDTNKRRESDFEIINPYQKLDAVLKYENESFKRRLLNEVFSPKTNSLASSLGLVSQFALNLQQQNWYIADLDSEKVQALESQNAITLNWRYIQGMLFGRAADEKLLKSFSISDTAFVSVLRLFIWLVPCPELGIHY